MDVSARQLFQGVGQSYGKADEGLKQFSMQVDLSKNFFELFALKPVFELDSALLNSRFQALQSKLHPDKFAAATDSNRRWSMQAASHVNEAYQTLSEELRRATYLLRLQDISVDDETDTQMSPMFLMEQMEYRESLEMAPTASDPFSALDKVRQKLKVGTKAQVAEFASAADQGDWDHARTVVRQWQFLDKLKREVRSVEEQLDD